MLADASSGVFPILGVALPYLGGGSSPSAEATVIACMRECTSSLERIAET